MEFARILREARRPAAFAALALTVAGCAYSVRTGLPSNITNVAIPTFGNNSVQYTLGRELTDAVTDRFVKDNHLQVVSSRDAQSVLEGTVLEYKNVVSGYNASLQAQEYRVGMRVQVRFKDTVHNKDVWNDVIETSVTYSTAAVQGQAAGSEDTGRKDLVNKVADEILSRTVFKW